MSNETVGKNYSLASMQFARTQLWRVIDAVVPQIQVGMREDQALLLTQQVLEQHAMERLWHPVIVRFGCNTLKTYRQKSEPDVTLAADDLFFLDLGAVWQGHEADCGATFAVGDNPLHQACAQAARTLFDDVAAYWQQQRVSGQVLYQYAQTQASAMGWQLNLQIQGHRLSEYPHAVYRGGALGQVASCPQSGVWALEIQLRHPQLPIGAFYEDLLVATDIG